VSECCFRKLRTTGFSATSRLCRAVAHFEAPTANVVQEQIQWADRRVFRAESVGTFKDHHADTPTLVAAIS
jgi:hypothetical protein